MFLFSSLVFQLVHLELVVLAVPPYLPVEGWAVDSSGSHSSFFLFWCSVT